MRGCFNLSTEQRNPIMSFSGQRPVTFNRLLKVSLITIVFLGSQGGHAQTQSTARHIDTDKTIGLENRHMGILFDKTTGSVVGVKNNATGGEYIKDNPGGLFRVYLGVQPLTEKPQGGTMITSADCVLIDHSSPETTEGQRLTLNLKHADSGLEFILDVELADDSVFVDCSMTVANHSQKNKQLMMDFPYLAGICLGDNRETNLGLWLAGPGIAGEKAWEDRAERYGDGFSMQWNAVYDKTTRECLGILILDKDFGNKWFSNSAAGELYVLHYPAVTVAPTERAASVRTRIMVNSGDWKPVAREYGRWFSANIGEREPPKWLDQIARQNSHWAPDWHWFTGQTEKPHDSDEKRMQFFPNFAKNRYLNNRVDARELACFYDWTGSSPSASDIRPDLGGNAAITKAIPDVHAIGRKVFLYLGGITYVPKNMKPTQDREHWVIKNRNGTERTLYNYAEAHPRFGHLQVAMCPGVEEWQDQIAQDAKRFVEMGADAVRLDELSFFIPCHNERHHHDTPFGWHQWVRQLVKKVRAAMDEVNPDALLWTEYFQDYMYPYSHGALVMFHKGTEISPLRVAFPGYGQFAHVGPGAFECALNSWITNRDEDRSIQFRRRGSTIRPEGHPEGGGNKNRWYELRSTFAEVMLHGNVADIDPSVQNAPKWVGRIFEGKTYWVMVGGHMDGSELDGAVKVKLAELPASITRAYEFDATTLNMREAELVRCSEGIYVTLTSSFAVVLLPKPDCPPLVQMTATGVPGVDGEAIKMSFKAFSPWRKNAQPQVNVEVPGLTIESPTEIVLPADVLVLAPEGTMAGNYYVRVTGQCLPLKRWFEVK